MNLATTCIPCSSKLSDTSQLVAAQDTHHFEDQFISVVFTSTSYLYQCEWRIQVWISRHLVQYVRLNTMHATSLPGDSEFSKAQLVPKQL